MFATRQDMATIKDIIDKLDVVLAQVLIETLIMDVTMDDTGTSAYPPRKRRSNSRATSRGRAAMNANTFFDFTGSSSTNALGELVGSGIKYFGKVNEDIYISMAAAASEGRVKVIQRPRIQTSHATPAQFSSAAPCPT